MGYTRRFTNKDATWARAWTADTLADLVTINAVGGPRHGDIAYVTSEAKYYWWQDDGTWVTPTSSGSAELLAIKSYNPNPAVSVTNGTTTEADVDATNLVITFTAPASGKVIVRLCAACNLAGATAVIWILRTTAGVIVPGSRSQVTGTATWTRPGYAALITGLTPSASYTWRWGFHVSADTATATIAYGDNPASTNPRGPAVMEVWAA